MTSEDAQSSAPAPVLLDQFTEFETKYEVEFSVLSVFKKIAKSIPDCQWFLYTEGPDTYFSLPDGTPGRYRVTEFPKEAVQFAQWTVKTKPEGAKNSIKRREPNWLVRGTTAEEIEQGALDMGFKYNFKIWKMCHIYKFADATIVFYTVIEDGKTSEQHLIEIEVDEETIHTLTEEQAWEIIRKYEKILAPTGVNPQKRLRRSLYDMYRKDLK